MSDLLSKMRAAHAARKAVRVHVPEYGVDLYFPPLTLADRDAIRRGVNTTDEHALMVEGLIHQARDADGQPAFPDTAESRQLLYQAEMAVLQRIIVDSAGDLPGAVAVELASLDDKALEGAARAMAAALESAAPDMAGLLTRATAGVLRRALAGVANDTEPPEPVKNG